MNDEMPQTPPAAPEKIDDDAENGAAATARSTDLGTNAYLRAMLDDNFLEYASYVIKDRAIPDVDDGLKPVQRRILWSLHRIDDGKTHKVANVIGDTMKFHPHGDASIGDALVVLANKEYFIHKQGNYGNIYTGHPAAAPRYIECSLSDLGREVLFNNDITELVDSYDGRNQEPVVLPVKVPALLMLGSYGIAVGMRTQIMPHNFAELLRAQIAELHGEEYELYPDFLQGGLMDVAEYDDGNGKINLRARIEIDGRKLIIREIPATTTTEGLIASIEKAADKGKIKIASINDFTAEKVEIEIVPTRGYDPQKALRALYMYTDCSVSISVNMMVICDGRPREMSVHSVLKRNTEKLLEYLRRELEIELGKLEDQFHAKTLAQIFIENRIYKRIEECASEEAVYAEVHAGLAPFRHLVRREITDEDVARLLTIQIGRISRFSIEKNQKELREILEEIDRVNRHLRHLREYAVSYLEGLLKKYGPLYPRRTEICDHFEKIDRRAAALNNIRIGWDRKNGYIGTGIKSDDMIICNEFDHLLQVTKDGTYKITDLPPDKLFVGRLYDCRRHDPALEFGVIYRDVKSGKCYGKRSVIGSFIKDREYSLCPGGCRLELLTPRTDAVYQLRFGGRGAKSEELNLLTLPQRTPRARGILVGGKNLSKIIHLRYLEPEEAEALRRAATETGAAAEADGEAPSAAPEAAEIPAVPSVVPEASEAATPPVASEAAAAPEAPSAAPEESAVAETPSAAPEGKTVIAADAAVPVEAPAAPETATVPEKDVENPAAPPAAAPESGTEQPAEAPAAPEGKAAAELPAMPETPAVPKRKPAARRRKTAVKPAPAPLPPEESSASSAASAVPEKDSAAPEPPSAAPGSGSEAGSDDDDDFGILQPEFGF